MRKKINILVRLLFYHLHYFTEKNSKKYVFEAGFSPEEVLFEHCQLRFQKELLLCFFPPYPYRGDIIKILAMQYTEKNIVIVIIQNAKYLQYFQMELYAMI